jgi:ADP-ribose pyrophosphatase YjhB (NUDIX family)
MSEQETRDESVSNLERILDSETVEVVETADTFDREAFESWQEAERERRNRAVAGVIRDDDGRVLLVRYHGDNRHTGWRLPGSPVGNVTAFEKRLEGELHDQFGVAVQTVSPVRVHAHSATHGGERATFYYVLCAVAFETRPDEAFRDVSPDDIEFDWFENPPEDLVNPDVVSPLFESGDE